MNIYICFSLILMVVCLSQPILRLSGVGVRVSVAIYTISTLFYGIMGVAYWVEMAGGVFVGAKWIDEVRQLPQVFLFIYLIFLFLIYFFSKFLRRVNLFANYESHSDVGPGQIYDPLNFTGFRCLIFVSIAAAIYTIIVGGKISEAEAAITSDPLMLIAYQFSDLGIALILLGLSTGQNRGWWSLAAIIFSLYAAWIGFRYRLVLLWVPIWIGFYYRSEKSVLKKLLNSILIGLAVVATFALMTVTRSKFGGVSTQNAVSFDYETIAYGLMAETNVVFGLSAALASFGGALQYAGVTPLIEVFLQFIPRFLYPEKNLYQHLWDVNYMIAGTDESLMSGTAMPFFGEYYAMGGWIGVFIGIAAYTLFLALHLNRLETKSWSRFHAGISAGLLGVTFCYYYFSRGSIAQISKAYLFVVFPYIYYTRAICCSIFVRPVGK